MERTSMKSRVRSCLICLICLISYTSSLLLLIPKACKAHTTPSQPRTRNALPGLGSPSHGGVATSVCRPHVVALPSLSMSPSFLFSKLFSSHSLRLSLHCLLFPHSDVILLWNITSVLFDVKVLPFGYYKWTSTLSATYSVDVRAWKGDSL